MIKVLFFIILLFHFSTVIIGQKSQIKKETIITKYYENALFWKGKVISDTIIKEYDINGTLISKNKPQSYSIGKIISRDSIKIIYSSKSKTHQREFWSDSSVYHIHTLLSKDSIVYLKLRKKDTLKIQKVFLCGKNKKKLRYKNFDFLIYGYLTYQQTVFYEKSTPFLEKAKVITRRHKDSKKEYTDTFKITIKYLPKTNIVETYDDKKKKWVEIKKKILTKRKSIIKETSFHNDHKTYFTTKHVFTRNKLGHMVKHEKYDDYFLLEETKYSYDYY